MKGGWRGLLKALRRTSMSSLAYISLLVAFIALGTFVAALATGSRWAMVLGVVLIACLAASVAGFRTAARKITRPNAITEPGSAVSIFSTPLRREQVDRYLENYRGGRSSVPQAARLMTVIAGSESTKRAVSPGISSKPPMDDAERHRLSA